MAILSCSQVPVQVETGGSRFVVNTTSDAVDANPGDGLCRDQQDRCTLRAAVMEANARSGADTIELPPGTYTLTIEGREEDSAASGDLDNSGTLSINGSGEADTLIDGNGLDRVLHNLEGATLELRNVSVRNGHAMLGDELFASAGGGLRAEGKVTLRNVTLAGNRGDGPGGAVAAVGDVSLMYVTVSGNRAASVGGGVVQLEGRMTLEDVNIDGNVSELIGGGLWQNDTGWMSLARVVVSNNSAIGAGGVDVGGVATVTDCVVRGNAATGSGPAVSGLAGGILTRGRPLRMINTVIEDNRAVRSGGGIFNAWVPIEEVPVTGTLLMEGGAISRNLAGESGGGFENFGGMAILRNVSITGNAAEAGPGGGILNSSPLIEGVVYPGRLSMSGGTVRGNRAGSGSGGIANSESGFLALDEVTITDNGDEDG